MKLRKTLLFTSLLAFSVATLSLPAFANSVDQQLNQAVSAIEEQRYSQALTLLIPLVEQGDSVAQGILGFMYEKGYGVKQDYKEAAKLFYASAKQGMAQSQFDLGMLYYKGLGLPQSNEKAAKLFKAACNEGKGIEQACQNYFILTEK